MIERKALQIAVAIAALVPVSAGFLGLMPGSLGLYGAPSAVTHLAYLSGLLLGIGLAFFSLIPDIERQGRLFSLLAVIVVVGGLARLLMALRLGAFTPSVALPLAMELGVTPLLWRWQHRISRLA